MNRKEAEEKNIIIYRWNCRSKTLDHKGTYKEFLDKKSIKIKEVKNKENTYKISFNCGCSKFNIEIYTMDIIDVFDTAIKSFLQYLGDRHLFKAYNREYRINWS